MNTEPPTGLSVLKGNPRATVAVRFLLPAGALVGLLASIALVFPNYGAGFYGFVAAYVLPPAGKETVIPAAIAAGFSPFLVATYIAGFDMTVAWFLAWNWEVVLRVPLVGPFVERMMDAGNRHLARAPLIDRSAFYGLVLFVFFPLQGSGAVAGTILGRLLGIGAQRTWLAVMIGALVSSFVWAYAAGAFRELVQLFGLDIVLQWATLGLAGLVLGWLVVRRVR